MSKKKDPERPRILLRKTGPSRWELLYPHDEERTMHYPIGAVVEATFWQNRSREHLSLYWVILHEVVSNSETWASTEKLHEALKIALGYTTEVRLLSNTGPLATFRAELVDMLRRAQKATASLFPKAHGVFERIITFVDNADVLSGNVITMPGSIALERMDQSEFRQYFDKAMNELRKAGYPIDAYIEEGKRKMAARIAYKQKTEPNLPYHGANNADRELPGAAAA